MVFVRTTIIELSATMVTEVKQETLNTIPWSTRFHKSSPVLELNSRCFALKPSQTLSHFDNTVRLFLIASNADVCINSALISGWPCFLQKHIRNIVALNAGNVPTLMHHMKKHSQEQHGAKRGSYCSSIAWVLDIDDVRIWTNQCSWGIKRFSRRNKKVGRPFLDTVTCMYGEFRKHCTGCCGRQKNNTNLLKSVWITCNNWARQMLPRW